MAVLIGDPYVCTPADFDIGPYGVLKCLHHEDSRWCRHQAYLLSHNLDPTFQFDSKYSIPVMPTQELWCMIQIDSKNERGDFAPMYTAYTPDFGPEKRYPLGLYNWGETRNSIRMVIMELIQTELPTVNLSVSMAGPVQAKCPSSIHNIAAQNWLNSGLTKREMWKCAFNLVFEGACTPCVEGSVPDTGLDQLTSDKPQWARP